MVVGISGVGQGVSELLQSADRPSIQSPKAVRYLLWFRRSFEVIFFVSPIWGNGGP